MGYMKGKNGFYNLLIVPETGLETELLFMLLHSGKYPLKIDGEVIFTGDSSPQIILTGNNAVSKKWCDSNIKVDKPSPALVQGSGVACGGR